MMKSYGLFGFLGLLSLSVVLALPARAEDSPQVFISEINWAGSQVSTADEWIELVNLGQTSIDLSHWVLTGTASSGGAIEIAEGTIVESGHTLLIANYALGDPKTTLLIAPELVTTAISLPNTALTILLTTPEGLVIDNYTDAGTPDFGLSNPATSIERDLVTMTWRSSVQSLNFSSTSQLGTPGSVILPVVTIDELGEITAPPSLPIAGEVSDTPTQVEAVSEVVETLVATEPPLETVINPESNTEVVLDLPGATVTTPKVVMSVEPEETAPVLEPVSPAIEIPPALAVSENTISNTNSIHKIAPGGLIINELVSDPIDGVEWVEILNASSSTLDLTGSTLVDAGDHITTLPAESLAAGHLLVIENPNGNLNNLGDTITLFDSYGTTIDTLTYGTTDIPAPKDGESLARNSAGVWLLASATRNMNNVFPVAVEESKILEPISPTTYEPLTDKPPTPVIDSRTVTEPVEAPNDAPVTATEPIYRIVAIAKPVVAGQSPATTGASKSKHSTNQMVVTGAVVALPDIFGKQILFIDGHEIYFHAADWPELALGDVIQITGTESTSNGAPRLKITNADAIVIVSHTDLIPAPIDGTELVTTLHGSLVSISGRVTGKNGNQLSVMTDDGVTVIVTGNKKTGVSWNSMQSGTIIVTGVVKRTDSGTVIAVRSSDDVHFTPEATLTAPIAAKTKSSTTPLVGGGLLTGSIGALGTWYLRSRKGLLSWLPI